MSIKLARKTIIINSGATYFQQIFQYNPGFSFNMYSTSLSNLFRETNDQKPHNEGQVTKTFCNQSDPKLHSEKRQRLVASCQFYQLEATCQQVATSLLKSGLLQLVIYRLVTTCWDNLQQACWNNQLATSLLTTCKRLVVNKLSQAMRTHPDMGLL